MACIVVPVDGSCLSESVIPYVEEFARHLEAEVYFVQVVETELAASDAATILGWVEDKRDVKIAEKYLSGLAQAWQVKGINAMWRVLEGKPTRSIVDFALSQQACMIAMCTRCRCGLGRVIFRSVANEVLREAGIPVLLIPPKKPKRARGELPDPQGSRLRLVG